MPLADLQSAIGTMIAFAGTEQCISVESAIGASALKLTKSEQEWLQFIQHSSGFKVTCAIQRWWRETRMRDMAKLTIQALGKETANQMIATYLRQNVCTSLFFLPETLSFLSFVAERSQQPHCRAIAQFERALLQAREEAAANDNLNSTATIIEFAASPLELLSALMQDQPLPPPAPTPFYVRVSSTLAHCWEPIPAEEVFRRSNCHSA